ncbi:MAG: DUF86 domain-containing protein [Deltaproteobacteria bacterium]|nr:DUF86 domain-containing protein [Deltaproteobacteria bacterium]
MTDKALIERKLAELEACLAGLEALKAVSAEDFRRNVERQWAAERGLQISVQIIIDISTHILSAEGDTNIEDYTEVIDRLGKKGIIPDSFAAGIRGMAGFRNILVHEYAGVDLTVVYGLLQNGIHDFRRFAGHISDYLRRGR